MYQVLYYSKGGNTKKLADVIAGELGVNASDLSFSSLDRDAKVIFLGSGVYAGKPGEEMARFIETRDFGGRKVVLFSTSWRTGEHAFDGLADTLKRRGAIVQRGYHCKGKAGIFNLGHPSRDDLEGARKYVRDIVRAG